MVSSEGVGWSDGGVGSSSCPRASFCALVVVPSSRIVVVHHLVGPFAAVVFTVVHHCLVVIMSWRRVSWSRFSGDIVVL